jgi:hypothetical protein
MKQPNYVNKAITFSNEVPSLAEQAVSDQQAAKELETNLEEMKKDIEEINELQPQTWLRICFSKWSNKIIK